MAPSKIPALVWQTSEGPNRSVAVTLDYTVNQDWIIVLNGTDQTGSEVKARYIVIDNLNNVTVCVFSYGPFRYSISPFTRKTFPIIYNTDSVAFSVPNGIVYLTLCNFNPEIPDDVNQILSNAASQTFIAAPAYISISASVTLDINYQGKWVILEPFVSGTRVLTLPLTSSSPSSIYYPIMQHKFQTGMAGSYQIVSTDPADKMYIYDQYFVSSYVIPNGKAVSLISKPSGWYGALYSG